MNRKSAGIGLRKSIRPRDSQIPSAGVPSSARRGLANRTALDATRNSVGGGRVSLYGQVNQKDPRILNDEFIQKTFGRIKDFLVQRRLNSDIVPSSNKLTLRQFENMFVTLFRFIDPTYNPPAGNQWLEHEVPILMEGYPHKVTKSMMQTVSSKPGPVVGILDYLLDLAMVMECEPAEAVRLLSKDDGALQVETEELARSSFVKGLPVTSPQLREQVLDLCTRHKGIMDEAEIRAERERVHAAQQEAEAGLQLLEEQLAERESVEEEYQQLVEYLEQMKSREANKKLDLERMHEEKMHLAQKTVDIEQLIGQTKNVVEGQPISVEEIRSMRTQSTELENTRSSMLSKMRSTESEFEAVSSSVRIVEAELENVCGEIGQLLGNGSRDGLRNFGRNDLIEAAKKSDEGAVLLQEMTEEFDLLNKKIAECRITEEDQMFELNQRKKQQQTMVDYAKQDKEALDEKLNYFSSRLAEKLEELLSRRRAVSGHENQLVFLDKEVEDLKVELNRQESQLSVAEVKLEQQRKEAAAALKVLEMEKQRIHSTVNADLARMKQLVAYYREAFASMPVEDVVNAVLSKVNTESMRKFLHRCLDPEQQE